MKTSTPPLPSGHVLRTPGADDAPAIAGLITDADLSLYGESDATPEDVRFIWGWPRFDTGRDAWRVATPGGALAAYAWVWGPRLPGSDCDGSLHLSPSGPAAELAAALIPLMEARARERVEEAGATGPAALVIPASSRDERKLALLADHGYRRIRTFFRMELALEAAAVLPAARWPAGVEVASFLAGHDEAELHDTIQESFADHFRFMPEPLEDWSRRSFGHADFSPELTFLARERGRVVAVSLNYLTRGDGWIGMLGVRRAWRHRGLATALLHHSFSAFRAAGCRRALLGVDSENADGATGLYESVGMHVSRRDHLHERRLAS